MNLPTGCRYFMNVSKRYNLRAFIILCLVLLAPLVALATACPPADSPQDKFMAATFSCPSVDPVSGIRLDTGITYRFTECVKSILKNVATNGITKMLNQMSKAVGATLTLFVAFTGMKMVLGGVRNMKSEALITLLRLAFVAAFALNSSAIAGQNGLQLIYNLVQGMNGGLIDLVSPTIVATGPCATAAVVNVKSAGGGMEPNVWKRVDCTILAFIGRSAPTYVDKLDENNNPVLDQKGNTVQIAKVVIGKKDVNCDGKQVDAPIDDITLFGIGLSQLFTPHGIFVLFLLGAAALMMFLAFAQALQVYVVSLVAIAFLIFLGPVIIPLCLFSQTRQMFVTWFSMIIGYIIQPAMMMAFLVFLLASMNGMLFGDPTATPPVPGLKDSLDKMNAAMNVNQCTVKVLAWEENAINGKDTDAPTIAPLAMLRQLGKEINAMTAPVTPVPYIDLAVFMVYLIACCVLLYVMMILMTNVSEFAGSISSGIGAAGAGGGLAGFGVGMKQLTGAVTDAFKNSLPR